MSRSSKAARRRRRSIQLASRARARAHGCACGKILYPTQQAALNAIGGGHAGHRTYWCDQGQGWHTTSKPKAKRRWHR